MYLRILFFTLLICKIGFSQNLIFDKIGKKDGLPDNNIFSIVQDGYGHLWFGTSNGLALYNGYTFRTWRHMPEDTNSLPHNEVDILLAGSKNELFVGNISKGIFRFNYHKEIFEPLDKSQKDTEKKWLCAFYSRSRKIFIGSSEGLEIYDEQLKRLRKINLRLDKKCFISSIDEDDKGIMWLYASNNCILKFNQETETVESVRFFNGPDKGILTRGGRLKYDSDGYIWIGTEFYGLFRYDMSNGNIDRFSIENGKLKSNIVLSILKDRKGRVWVGTDIGGIYKFSASSDETPSCYLPALNSEEALSSSTIYSLYEIEPELLLIGTFAGGLNVLNDYRHKFVTYNDKGPKNQHLNNKSALAFNSAENGKIWIGTDGGGLNLFDPDTKEYEYFTKENNKLPHSDVSKSIFVDSKKRIWVGSYAGGIAVLSPDMKVLKVFSNENMSDNIGSDHAWKMTEDLNGNIWIGLLNNGAERISPDLSKITHYHYDVPGNSGFKSAAILVMVTDKKGMVWAISESLHYFDPVKDKFIEYIYPGIALPSNLKDLCVDGKGDLWAASSDASIFKIPFKETESPVIFPASKGWFGNEVLCIQNDNDGNIWMATDVGISILKFTGDAYRFLNFDINDGVQTGQFNASSKLKDAKGYIYFGGSEGYHRFHPKDIKLNYHLPNVSISDIRIFNQPLSSFPKYHKTESVFWNDSTIHFQYMDKMISIEFAGLDFVLPEKNRFAYILEGFDSDWNYTSSGAHLATYTNLDPGSYTFKVRAANNDGQWNNESSQLYIVVLPPWWATWWFRALIVLSLIGALVGFFFWRTKSIRQRNLELKREVDSQTNELRQINEELQQTAEEVNRQNNEISRLFEELTESIQAAQVIQTAILPGKDILNKYFNSIDVLYKPKDVVSGDFYWCAQSGNRFLLAVVDCTGHGVAGAFMTFIGYETLNQVLRENPKATAGQFVSILNKEIIYSMNHYQAGINAGMDVALCIYDKDTNTLEFAGANDPLYIIRNNEILIFKGDRQGVGGKQKTENYQFETFSIPLLKGDQVYIFSDGYADQMGGVNKNEKFMYPRFRQELLNTRHLPIEKRISKLEKTFDIWRNGYEQLDDVLVISFEVQ